MNKLTLLVMAAVFGCAIARYQNWYDTREEDEAKLSTSIETPCRLSREFSSKSCNYGTYLNKECGYRQDCLQGPGEPCTEKMEDDNFGLRCAPGYVCSKKYARCVGIRFDVDSNALLSVMWGPGHTGHALQTRSLRPLSNL